MQMKGIDGYGAEEVMNTVKFTHQLLADRQDRPLTTTVPLNGILLLKISSLIKARVSCQNWEFLKNKIA
jgi:hypothetical protein